MKISGENRNNLLIGLKSFVSLLYLIYLVCNFKLYRKSVSLNQSIGSIVILDCYLKAVIEFDHYSSKEIEYQVKNNRMYFLV